MDWNNGKAGEWNDEDLWMDVCGLTDAVLGAEESAILKLLREEPGSEDEKLG